MHRALRARRLWLHCIELRARRLWILHNFLLAPSRAPFSAPSRFSWFQHNHSLHLHTLRSTHATLPNMDTTFLLLPLKKLDRRHHGAELVVSSAAKHPSIVMAPIAGPQVVLLIDLEEEVDAVLRVEVAAARR